MGPALRAGSLPIRYAHFPTAGFRKLNIVYALPRYVSVSENELLLDFSFAGDNVKNMELKLSDFPQISEAPICQKLEFIDDLWEQVRRSTTAIEVPSAHLDVLEQRLNTIQQNPSLALSPGEARAQLRR